MVMLPGDAEVGGSLRSKTHSYNLRRSNPVSMEKNQKIILVAGVLITLGLLVIDVFFALIAFVCVLALLMTIHIMGETGNYLLIAAELAEDARGVIISNTGTGEARNIHVTLVPLDLDFDIASLKPDEASRFELEAMVTEAKAIITYEDTTGQKQTRTYPLSALSSDLLKPMFPVFEHR